MHDTSESRCVMCPLCLCHSDCRVVDQPRRIRMSRRTPWRHLAPDAVIVDRRSRWGNPYTVAEHGRARAVARSPRLAPTTTALAAGSPRRSSPTCSAAPAGRPAASSRAATEGRRSPEWQASTSPGTEGQHGRVNPHPRLARRSDGGRGVLLSAREPASATHLGDRRAAAIGCFVATIRQRASAGVSCPRLPRLAGGTP
jgi:hypothetical protein